MERTVKPILIELLAVIQGIPGICVNFRMVQRKMASIRAGVAPLLSV